MVFYKSFPDSIFHTPHWATEDELKRRIDELIDGQYDFKKEIFSFSPKGSKHLRLYDIPNFPESDETNITRNSGKRKSIRVDCVSKTNLKGQTTLDYQRWGLAMMETREKEKEYDYFNKLLEEVGL